MEPLAARSSCCVPLSARLPWARRSVFFAGDVQRVETNAVVGQRGVDAALALEMNAGDGDFQLLQAGFAAELLGVGEGPSTRDRSGQRGFAAESFDVGQLEQRIDVEAREIERAWVA